ncbi:MAG: chemotaxis protein CheA [Candidatus Krumholzibacteria bacterium]|nr:chemotaxis protein CheA [Candidatus Krumholzibacteria bacterium]
MQVADYKALFISEAGEILQALEAGVMALESGEDRRAAIEELFRHAHNLKGMSGAMGYDQVVEASHALENLLDRCRRGELVIAHAEADLLLRAIDLLAELVRRTVSDDPGDVSGLLGDILVMLSPMAMRPDAQRDRGEESCGTEAADGARGDPGASAAGCPEEPAAGEDGESSADESDPAGALARPSPVGRFSTTRVDLGRLDTLMDLVGELIISRIRLAGIAKQLDSKVLREELSSSGRLISEIQKEVMEARLIPVGQVFQRMRRVVRDTARELGKSAELEIVGSEIGLDRTVLEAMVDPLVHLLRNAVDHGIETQAERAVLGKHEKASVKLSARRERNFVVLEVSDDGRGIDLESVRARQGAAADSDAPISNEELCRVLSAPGFSTKAEVSRYSGRGVGMNVVRRTVDSLGGSMTLHTESGKGTTVRMNLPINLSIIKALLFEVGDDIHALPVEYVKETLRVERESFGTVMGREVYRLAEGPVPVVRPDDLFRLELPPSGSRYMKLILVDTGEGTVALVTGRILGQQDIVIKGLPTMIRGVGGISGATILGSGRIAFIWDPRFLFKGRCADESDRTAVVPEDRRVEGTG